MLWWSLMWMSLTTECHKAKGSTVSYAVIRLHGDRWLLDIAWCHIRGWGVGSAQGTIGRDWKGGSRGIFLLPPHSGGILATAESSAVPVPTLWPDPWAAVPPPRDPPAPGGLVLIPALPPLPQWLPSSAMRAIVPCIEVALFQSSRRFCFLIRPRTPSVLPEKAELQG